MKNNHITKIIAFYLPQFHEIPENNTWWGKGFTEWTNARKALPLFSGHDQPKVPLNNNYYNLLDTDVHKWQIKIAKQHGVYGFCYYHYWFSGKKLLEKPVELVLKNKLLGFPYCLSWANESWLRTWYGAKREVLIEQSYGGLKEWVEHYQYLSRHFLDKRYIKIGNKPLFLIYKPSQIKQLDSMIGVWNKLAIEDGFDGIHVVETLTSTQARSYSSMTEGVVYYEPGYSIKHASKIKSLFLILKTLYIRYLQNHKCLKKYFMNKKLLNRIDYDWIYNEIIKRDYSFINKKVYLGAFVKFDDTARRNERAVIIVNDTAKKFQRYLHKMLKKSMKQNSEYLFLTAWNEWAEGAYLEPDKRDGYNYLNAIRNAVREVDEYYD